LFEGNQALFNGLAAENQWDWGKKHPVIRVSFADGVLQSRAALDQRIQGILRVNRELLGVARSPELPESDIAGNFSDLIRQAHQASGQRAVVLIEDYDKPILDNISHPDVVRDVCNGLLNFYFVIKGCDEHIKFALLTGVCKFSMSGLFSGLNNLTDITLDARYGTLCGYTDAEVNAVFILLQLFRNRAFRPYWCEAESPAYLLKLLTERGVFMPSLERKEVSSSALSNLDFDQINCDTLLFQTGYLSLKKVEQPMPGYWVYTIGYPNQAVRTTLNAAFLASISSPKRRLL